MLLRRRKAPRTRTKLLAAASAPSRLRSAVLPRPPRLTLYRHSVTTAAESLFIYTDEDGAVRSSGWAEQEARVQDTLRHRVYTGWDLVFADSPPAAGDQPGAHAAALLQTYFDTVAPSTGRIGVDCELNAYHESLQRSLDAIPVALPPFASFTAAVLQTLRHSVTAGSVISYKALAERVAESLNRPSAAPRAVGQAMAANPIPVIIPCHRVVATSRALHGFSGGLQRKAWLLRHERAALPMKQLLCVEVGESRADENV